jgi:KaiC/GvpD/RAD55 family RecA-like ATPase
MLATNEDVTDEIEEYLELCRATSLEDEKEQHELLNLPTIDDLVGTEEQGDLIPMYPKALNERLEGGLIRGHHVLVFARPEMGKTMFLVNLTRGFLRHGLKVLYLGNEEPVKLTFLRMVQRLAELTRYEVLTRRDEAIEIARQAGMKNLYMKQLTPGTPREVEALCEEVKPDVLIVDQLRHLSVGKTDGNFVRQLEMAANAVRQIGSRQNALAISVTQAGESAAGKPVLDMEDVDFSNTGIQGAVDVMIGIGASKDDENAGRRVISLPKNKRTGRHDFFPVEVDIQLNRVVSMDC